MGWYLKNFLRLIKLGGALSTHQVDLKVMHDLSWDEAPDPKSMIAGNSLIVL
jgi:hypothetical protein